MKIYNIIFRFIFLLLFENFIIIDCSNETVSYGMKWSKAFKLNNGNIIIAGNTAIKTYGSNGINLLYDYPIAIANQIASLDDAGYTNFAQFSEENNGIGIIAMKKILYILNNVGKVKFEYEHKIDLGGTKFFSIVPYIYKDNYYHFILGYINQNKKANLQYYFIDLPNETLIIKGFYLFDENDDDRKSVEYNYGISCQFMNHKEYKIVLTCFYQNNYPSPDISAKSFKLRNNNIEEIPDLKASYSETSSYCIQSATSLDKKNTLLCYIKNNYKLIGYCAVYNIDDNSFYKNKEYISSQCQTDIYRIGVNYYKETKEYIFSCTSTQAQIYILKLDENFDIIHIESNKNEVQLVIDECYNSYLYSILLISDKYTVFGDFYCYGEKQITALYSIPTIYDPITIYSDLEEISLNDDPPISSEFSYIFKNEKSIVSTMISTSNLQKNSQQSTIISKFSTTTISFLSSSTFLNYHRTTTPSFSTSTILNSVQKTKFSTYMKMTTFQNSPSSNISTSGNISKSSLINTFKTFINSYSTNNNFYSTSLETKIYSSILTKNSYSHISSTIFDSSTDVSSSYSDENSNSESPNPQNSTAEICHKSCETCEKSPDINSKNCLTCRENFELNSNNNCLYKYNYYFNQTIQEIIYLLANQYCPEELPYEIILTKECKEDCTNEEFINNICKINHFSGNNINEITNKIRSLINESVDSNYDVVVDGNNIVYEVTTTASDNEHYNISSIDFGKCEKTLKDFYTLDYLLVFKIDIQLNDSIPKMVEYEVYSPVTKQKLNLSLCENDDIDVYVPINLNENTNDLYDKMSKYGFDIFNENNSFYHDICLPFTTEEGTDATLSDRQNTYYNGSLALCESSCIYQNYNSTRGKAKCQCKIKQKFTEIKTITYDKLDINTLFDIKTITNIELIKCFKLVFSKNGIYNNYGSIIIICFISIFLLLIILYHINERRSISSILRKALKANNIETPPKKHKTTHKSHLSPKFNIDSNNSHRHLHSNNQKNNNHSTHRDPHKHNNSQIPNHNHNNSDIHKKGKSKTSITVRHLIDKSHQKTIERKKTKKLSIKNKENKSMKPLKKKIIFKENDKYSRNIKKENNHIKRTLSKKEIYNDVSIYPFKDKSYANEKTHCNENKILLNDYELNNLNYKKAIYIDKRTYFQYYWSLIRTKHIILYIFLPSNDYNLVSTKIGLLIFSFCLYFTTNAFFFTDKTMHKIYENKGIFDIVSQLPHILYSAGITIFINMPMRTLALSEKKLMDLKEIKNKDKALKKSSEIYRCLVKKFNLFFFTAFILLLFFWYYLAAFCAVYQNTQIILIQNTLLSFLFTLLHPFVLNILPGIFRIPSLRAKNKDKESFYLLGNIIALI